MMLERLEKAERFESGEVRRLELAVLMLVGLAEVGKRPASEGSHADGQLDGTQLFGKRVTECGERLGEKNFH